MPPDATGDNARGLASLDTDIEIRSSFGLNILNAPGSLLFQRVLKLRIEETVRESFLTGYSVHYTDRRTDSSAEILNRFKQMSTFRREVDGADNAAPLDVLTTAQRLHMSRRPDRAVCIVKNFGGDRAQQGGAEGAASPRRNHDQTNIPIARQARDT